MAGMTLGGFIFLVALGILPSLAWLWYYLHKDNHPEPKRMVIAVFAYGFVSVAFAFGAEWLFVKALLGISTWCPTCTETVPWLLSALNISATGAAVSFFVLSTLAFIEEYVKYAAAKLRIIQSKYFDEPVDAMIYLVVAALGFAAAENIGYILQNANHAIDIAYFRFVSATFLHALASAIVGYFLALSLAHERGRGWYIAGGIGIATALHALFNFLIMKTEQGGTQTATLLVFALMFSMFLTVSFLFEAVQRLSLKPRPITQSL